MKATLIIYLKINAPIISLNGGYNQKQTNVSITLDDIGESLQDFTNEYTEKLTKNKYVVFNGPTRSQIIPSENIDYIEVILADEEQILEAD